MQTGRHTPDPEAALTARFVTLVEEKRRTTLAAFAARYRADFLGFCRLLEIKPKEGGRIRFAPTQAQLAYCAARSPRDVILKCRQARITTIELARDVWFALVRPGSNVRLVCQSVTGSAPLRDFSERVELMIASLRRNAGLELPLHEHGTGFWTFENASTLRIIEAGASRASATKKGRGGAVQRLHTTEVAFWEWAGETLNAMLESVAGPEHGTEIVHESTPNGAGPEPDDAGPEENSADLPGGPWFYRECRKAQRGRGGYRFQFIPWTLIEDYIVREDAEEPPRNDRERALVASLLAQGATTDQARFYLRKVRDKGPDTTRQEYPSDADTCFLMSGRGFFDRPAVEALLLATKTPALELRLRWKGADGTLRIWHSPEPGRRYVIASDVSEGEGGARGGGQVWERVTGRHMATLHGQFKPGELARALAALTDTRYPRLPAADDAEAREDLAIVRSIQEQFRPLEKRYAGAIVAPERNNHGHSTIRALEAEQRYPQIFRDRDGKLGWLTSPVTRQPALDALEAAIRNAQWASSDRDLLRELRSFVWRDDKPQAQAGTFDDLVMMAAIGWDLLKRPEPRREVGQQSIGIL